MGLTTEKVAELLKDESDAAKEYTMFAEKLWRLSREATEPETIQTLKEMAVYFDGMSRDERRHHRNLEIVNEDVPSESCEIPEPGEIDAAIATYKKQ